MRVGPGKIKMILRVAGRIASGGHTLRLAIRQRLGINGLLFLELERGFDECDREPSDDVPFHMAMHQPYARVVGLEPHDSVTCWGNHDSVSLHWDAGEAGGIAIPSLHVRMMPLMLWTRRIDTRPASNELHGVAMQV